MKTLPDNPHLDHLRRQAKDLLAGLRDTDPDTSLSAAQAALAGQYGFRTWTDLKAEVDRVRGRADVADPALATAIAERYGLGAVTGPMRSLARGDDMGRRWSLPTDRGRWTARTMDTWIPIVDAETDVALQLAAAGAGISLPAPVRSRSGKIVESIGGHAWRVYEWRDSGQPLAAPVSATVAHAAGRIVATVHKLALPVDRISPWHASRLSGDDWSDLVATTRARRAGWADALAGAIPVLADLETLGDGVPTAPPVLCHNNLTPGNTRHGPDGRLTVLAWEHAGGQPPAWEFANTLAQWAVHPGSGVNVAATRAMAAGYRAVAGALPPLDLAMFRGTAIGIVNDVHGLVDAALTARDEEDRRFAERNLRHRLAHLSTRDTFARLLAVLEADRV